MRNVVSVLFMSHVRRAVGMRKADEMTWFWTGSHADYEKLLRAM
jgi:hypothetical protein